MALVLVVLALAPLVIWSGDIPWTTDEPRLIAQAWHCNQSHSLASSGLSGNFGVPYGPVPTQIYQLLLLITHDLETVVLLRGLLCGGLTAISLLWIARSLNLPAWFAAAILAAPYVTSFHRILWDASFTIPLSTLALASFADFLRMGRARSLRICCAVTSVLPIIHPQALPFSLALGGYLVWRRRDALWQDRRALGYVSVMLIILHAAYIPRAVGAVVWRFTGNHEVIYPGTGSRMMSLLAPFLGGRLLGGYETFTEVDLPGVPDFAVSAARWITLLIYPLIWLGIGFAAYSFSAVFRLWRDKRTTPGASARAMVLDEVSAVLLIAVVLQMALFFALRIPTGPQYLFGSFATLVFFGWLGMVRASLLPIGALYGAAGCCLTLGSMATVHSHGYARTGWIKLGNALDVARSLNTYSDTQVRTDVAILERSPQILRTLRLLIPITAGTHQRASGRLFITWREARGEIELRELTPNEAIPPGSLTMDVTPLPRDWVPDPSTW